MASEIINTGIGTITYTTTGSIDLQELMQSLSECIASNNVRQVIKLLDATK